MYGECSTTVIITPRQPTLLGSGPRNKGSWDTSPPVPFEEGMAEYQLLHKTRLPVPLVILFAREPLRKSGT